MITVMVVDDNATVRAAVRLTLHTDPDISVIAEAGDGSAAVTTAARLHPRVTLLDHRMPIADGLSVIGELAAHTGVLVLTGSTDPQLIAPMLGGGARGYLMHGQFDPPELLRAVHAIADGHGWLAPPAASTAAALIHQQYAARRIAPEPRAHPAGLTDREAEVLDLLCAGLSNAALADRLGLREKTVKNHLYHVFTKLGVTSRTQAVAAWRGWT
jgi:DNA-binding NarL/FixJ family response regulator